MSCQFGASSLSSMFTTGVMHEADNAYLIQSTWLCYRLVRFLTVAYSGKHCILDLSLIYLLLSFCYLDVSFLFSGLWVLSQTIKLLTSYEMFSSCFLVSLWVQDRSLPCQLSQWLLASRQFALFQRKYNQTFSKRTRQPACSKTKEIHVKNKIDITAYTGNCMRERWTTL